MKAELIAVGSEMLRCGRRDTNGDWLLEQLERLGVGTAARTVVEDEPERIGSCVRRAVERVQIVLVCGGLGPTQDDLTRDGIARGLDLPLERDPERQRAIEELFASRDREFQPVQARQADRPRGAVWLENRLGTAPGLMLEAGGARLFVLPGVPAELKGMFRDAVLPVLPPVATGCAARRTLKVAGRTESWVDRRVADLYRLPGIEATILTGREGIELHLLSRGGDPDEAMARLEVADARISERLGGDLYARDETSLAAVCGRLLSGLGATVATAESCTAGLLAAAITDVPGSTAWFRGGVVVYSNALKTSLAGVLEETLHQHGAVSEAVARELAGGARERCGADYGIGITGIAGPGGGTNCKPAGLVHVALADASGMRHWRTQQFGDRDLVRRRTVVGALDRLRRSLLERTERESIR